MQAPEEALLGLWFGLLRGCDDAMAAAIAAGKPVKEAVLDFYGVPVKAQDVRQFVERMRLLADKARPPPSGAPAPLALAITAAVARLSPRLLDASLLSVCL